MVKMRNPAFALPGRDISSLYLLLLSATFLADFTFGRDIGQFWHVTDFHYDHTYGSTGLSCNEKVQMDGYFGDYWCDSPWTLVANSVNSMKQLEPNPDFIIWTGDTVAHIKDQYMNLQINEEIVRNITNILTNAFPSIPVYATLGNHDFFPSDQAGLNDPFYRSAADAWSHWIDDPEQEELFKKGGYYYKDINPTIRLFGLNTNLYLTSNHQTNQSTLDPADQFEWLNDTLAETRRLKKKAIITAHVTPGLLTPDFVVWMYPTLRTRFVNILLEYSDIITATHFGHDHSDNFKLLQREDGSRAVAQFVAPSVTPWRYKIKDKSGAPHNPGLRLVSYDRTTGDHIDYDQYFMNLTDSNAKRSADWKKLYTFTEAYDVPDLSVSSLKLIYEKMSNFGNGYTQKFLQFAVVSKRSWAISKDDEAGVYCGGVHVELTDAKQCKGRLLNGATAPLVYSGQTIVFLLAIFGLILNRCV